ATMTPLQPLQHIAHPRALHSFPTRRSSDLSEQRDSPVEVSIDSLLNTMTLSEKIGQLFFIRARGYFKNTADGDYRRLLSRINDFHIGGLVFFKGTVYGQAVLTNALQRQSKIPLWVTQDMEFGAAMRVERTTRIT